MASLSGVWVAMPTPWNADWSIDRGAVREMVYRYHAAGLQGAYTTGTDGEMHVVDRDAFAQLADAFGDAAGRTGLSVQMGCTASDIVGVIERARIAQAHGIHRIQVAFPSWLPISDVEMLAFFTTLQESLPEMEIVHYNLASTGRFMDGDDYRVVREVAPNLVGSKHTGGSVTSLIDITSATPDLDHFVVDTQIVPGALFGAKGFYSFLANLSPALGLALWNVARQGQWERGAALRRRIDAFMITWRKTCPDITASPALVKIAAGAWLFPGVPLRVRGPWSAGSPSHIDQLKQLFEEAFPEFIHERN